MTQCPRAGTTACHSVTGSAHQEFCNVSPTVGSESSGELDTDLDSETSDSEYECESENEDSCSYCLQHDHLAPEIDLPILREGATVEELAVPSAEESVDAQLQDPDLISLHK